VRSAPAIAVAAAALVAAVAAALLLAQDRKSVV
jgi:hypothetical protein